LRQFESGVEVEPNRYRITIALGRHGHGPRVRRIQIRRRLYRIPVEAPRPGAGDGGARARDAAAVSLIAVDVVSIAKHRQRLGGEPIPCVTAPIDWVQSAILEFARNAGILHDRRAALNTASRTREKRKATWPPVMTVSRRA